MMSAISTLRAPDLTDAATTRGITLPKAHEVINTSLPCNASLRKPCAMIDTRWPYWNSKIAEMMGCQSTRRIRRMLE